MTRWSCLAGVAVGLAALVVVPRVAVAEDPPEKEVVELRVRGKPPPAVKPTASPAVPCSDSQACARELGYGNVCREGSCTPYADTADIMGIFQKDPKPVEPPQAWRLYPSIIPAIGYNPALGFLIGLVGKGGIYLGDPADTTISNASLLVLLTTNKQLVVQIGTTVLTMQNEWQLIGDWRFLLYNQDTYGLGTGTPLVSTGFSIMGWGDTAPIDGGQPMKFDLLRFHQIGLRRVWEKLYVGLGWEYDRYFGIQDELLNLSGSPPVVTSHYAYNTYFGFSTSDYTVSGVSLNAAWDSRDSTINAYRGTYARVALGGFPTWLGSSQGSTQIGADLRAYVGLSDDVPRNVLAFWVLATGITSGHQPYLTLPSIGWDAAGTTGRGYVQGRWRGTASIYAEAEWRFGITHNGLLGGALFANAVTMSRPAFSYGGVNEAAEDLFGTVRPAAGFGARIMMSKESRTNLRVDFAWGVNSFAVYLGAGEVF